MRAGSSAWLQTFHSEVMTIVNLMMDFYDLLHWKTSKVQMRICVLNYIEILPVITVRYSKAELIQAKHIPVLECSVGE